MRMMKSQEGSMLPAAKLVKTVISRRSSQGSTDIDSVCTEPIVSFLYVFRDGRAHNTRN